MKFKVLLCQWSLASRMSEKMKLWFVMEIETYKDDARRKKFYEYYQKIMPIWQNKLEGVKSKFLGGWADTPGCPMLVYEFESMEEFSKVWSDEEWQKELVILRNHLKSFRMRIMRPDIDAPPE